MSIVINAFSGYGFPQEAPVTYLFPAEMFLAGSDLTPLEEHINELLDGLLTWTPTAGSTDSTDATLVDVSGIDLFDAFINVNNLYIRNMWGDSLPIVPPTEEIVDWILRGTDMSPDTIISGDNGVMPRGGIATVKMVAIALAMAGGRPEHLPFLIAAVKAITSADAGMANWNATTNSVIPAFVVNGPASKDIRLGSGYGCLGPDPAHPASQAMGRAVRLIQQNLGGALPGNGTMAIHGGMRATNAFFAEDEDGIPATWTSWAEDRGFTRSQNVVTFTLANSMCNITLEFGDAAANDSMIRCYGGVMAYPILNRYSQPSRMAADNLSAPTGMLLFPRAFAKAIVDENGYTKSQVKQMLWDNSQVPFDLYVSWGISDKVLRTFPDLKSGDMTPWCPNPEQITIVIAGGDQGGHGYYMGPLSMGNTVSMEVELPKAWSTLIAEAEEDYGPKSLMR